MKKSVLLVACSLALSGCASNKNRHPSSDEELTLTQIIEEIKNTSERQKTNGTICTPNFDDLYQRLFNLAGDPTYLSLNSVEEIDTNIKMAFDARLSLRDIFKDFKGDSECFRSVTDVYRGLRYVEDYLVEMRLDKTGGATDFIDLKGEYPYLMVNPKFASEFKSYEDLNSGDLILSRGNAFSSAAIARIGKNDYQFSHISFVYKDPDTKKLFTTEAHIEIGSVVEPLMDHINSGNSRSVVYRYSDAQIAHNASKIIYDKVLENQSKKKTIQYDYSMNIFDNDKVYCSEIVSMGFKGALPEADYFPMFKSKLSVGTIPFLNRIGVPATKDNIDSMEIFAPGDIQFDPRFEMVAEWRNPKKTEESRNKDFILTKMFEYMDKYGHKIDPSFVMDTKAKSLWLLRRAPLIKRFLENRFPLNMNADQLELFMAVDKIGDIVYKEVERASLEYDRPMTPKEIQDVLEHFFKQDFELYKRYKKGQDVGKPLFHGLFHP